MFLVNLFLVACCPVMFLPAAESEFHRPVRPKVGDRLAALDLGTNNCRLLIAELRAEGLVIVDSFSRIVRLGEGLAATGTLSEAAMDRTISALRICARMIARHRVAIGRCVATEACRRAANGGAFLQRVARATGLQLEILPQDDEARLAMLGCLPLLDPLADQVLVVDIGGGSTEIMWLDRRAPAGSGEPGQAVSLPMGVVTLSERFGPQLGTPLHQRADSSDFYLPMVAHVAGQLAAERAAFRLPGASAGHDVQMVGTSGTVTTLAAVHLGLKRYDRRRVDGISLPFSAVDTVSAWLRDQDDASRAAHPCIGQGRADLVVAGCAILAAIHQVWPVEYLRVADRGVREGILAALTGNTLHQLLHCFGA